MKTQQQSRTTLHLTLSTLKMFVRNRQSLFFSLFMPVIIMTIFGLIGFDRTPSINIGVVVSHPSPTTVLFVNQLKKVSSLSVTTGSEGVERAALQKGDRAIVLLLPDDLIPLPGTVAPKAKTVTVLTNAGKQQQSQTGLSIISQLLDKTTIALSHAPQLFTLQTQEVNARNLRYIDFLIPGVVALAVMQMAVFSVAFVFVDYKEKGILKRLLATPMRPYQFVTANVITRLLLALLQTAILISLGVLLYHSHIVGSYLLVLLITVLGAIMFLGLGFSISGMAKTVDAVPAIANLIVFPMLFLGGTFFPIDSMPNWLQHAVTYLPLTHFSDALRMVMTDGKGLSSIAPDLYWMIGWSVVLIALAMYTFRFEERRV
ncbi:MAG: ABC transporter permease [bacterium]